MKTFFCLFFGIALLGVLLQPVASAAKRPPPFGQSLEWNTESEAPNLDALEGKSVLVMFYQSWCGICNGWSGELFGQMVKAYGDDP